MHPMFVLVFVRVSVLFVSKFSGCSMSLCCYRSSLLWQYQVRVTFSFVVLWCCYTWPLSAPIHGTIGEYHLDVVRYAYFLELYVMQETQDRRLCRPIGIALPPTSVTNWINVLHILLIFRMCLYYVQLAFKALLHCPL